MVDGYGILERVQNGKPLVHHLTNWVTIYDCANMTRAFGALPVMAHAIEEVEEMVGIAGALVLNIGTLTSELIDSMIKAGKKANEKGIPVVLDAVGVGATKLRTDSATRIMEEVKVSVVKGNSSEIGVLAGVEAEVKGVEAMSLSGDLKDVAKQLAETYGGTVALTSAVDVVTDGSKTFLVENGHTMMGSIVGTGCMAASVIGAFCAVEQDHAKAAAVALACYGIAGELAAENSKGPGSFKENFYDEVYNLDKEKVDSRLKINEG